MVKYVGGTHTWEMYQRFICFNFGEKQGVPDLGPRNIILVILKLELKTVIFKHWILRKWRKTITYYLNNDIGL